MDVAFASIKWQGSAPSIKRFMLWFWGGIALPFYRQFICSHLMQTFWGGQALSFYRKHVCGRNMLMFFPRPDRFCSKITFKPCVCLIMFV